MTIRRFGSKEAVLAGVFCIESDQREKAFIERAIRSRWESERFIQEYNALQSGEDHFASEETGIGNAESRAVAYDALHPDETVVVYRFDVDHLIPIKEAAELYVLGLNHAFALATGNS
ncbi:hypothetical protein HY948_02275 [Candidatus Gottesmanbacteria bacterium]|nr:hypothetical protein [Candidatus Gottesmanbacteria bacterium]